MILLEFHLSDSTDSADSTDPETESSRAAPILGSTRAGGHADASYHKLPQMIWTVLHVDVVTL